MKMEEYKEKTKIEKVKSCFNFAGRQYKVLQAAKIHDMIRDDININIVECKYKSIHFITGGKRL